MRLTGRFKGLACINGAGLSWGAAVVLSKGALLTTSPGVLLLIQLVTSVVVLAAILSVKGITYARARAAVRFAWLGLLEPGVTYLVGYYGLANADAGLSSIILASEAMLVVLLSLVFLHERISTRFVAYAGIVTIGLVLALWIGPSNPSNVFGIMMNFCAALLAASYVVLSGAAADADDPIPIVVAQQLAGLLLISGYLCIFSRSEALHSLSTLTLRTWVWSCASGFAAFALPFALYLAGLRRVSVSVAGISLSLTPVVGIVLAQALLDEHLAAHQLLGAGLVIIGLMFINAESVGDAEQGAGAAGEVV